MLLYLSLDHYISCTAKLTDCTVHMAGFLYFMIHVPGTCMYNTGYRKASSLKHTLVNGHTYNGP